MSAVIDMFHEGSNDNCLAYFCKFIFNCALSGLIRRRVVMLDWVSLFSDRIFLKFIVWVSCIQTIRIRPKQLIIKKQNHFFVSLFTTCKVQWHPRWSTITHPIQLMNEARGKPGLISFYRRQVSIWPFWTIWNVLLSICWVVSKISDFMVA